jgi:hypothetical protein
VSSALNNEMARQGDDIISLFRSKTCILRKYLKGVLQLKRIKQLDTKQIPEREMKTPKPVICVKFELIFLNRNKPCKKRKYKCHLGESLADK